MNIKEIARLCGVSTATISRVLNNKPDVSEGVRSRVLDTIKELNFSPKLTANRSNVLGVTVEYHHALSSPYVTKILESVEDIAYEAGYDVLILRNERLRQVRSHYGVFLRQKMIAGLIMLLTQIEDTFPQEIAEEGFPHMVVSNRSGERIHCVDADWYSGSLEATRYLISMGHANIAFLQPLLGHFHDHQQRLQGYLEAHREAGIVPNQELIIDTGGSSPLDYGFDGLNTILNKNIEVTAVMTINDAVGGVIESLRAHNLSIPEDMSVISFDDSLERAYFYPSLSVVAQDANMLGRLAAKEVIEQIEMPAGIDKPVRTVLPTKLIIRQTTEMNKLTKVIA